MRANGATCSTDASRRSNTSSCAPRGRAETACGGHSTARTSQCRSRTLSAPSRVTPSVHARARAASCSTTDRPSPRAPRTPLAFRTHATPPRPTVPKTTTRATICSSCPTLTMRARAWPISPWSPRKTTATCFTLV